ncbi:hypothetical protein ACNKHW_16950 [Shigella flexneri]
MSQKGSLVNDKVLRFDFSHFEAMTPEEIREVEELVNAEIRNNEPMKPTSSISKPRKRKVRWRCSAKNLMNVYAC